LYNLRIVSDLDECRGVWKTLVPEENLFDLWEVRDCFHRHFKHPLHFIIAEDERGICGFLPLSWVEESNRLAYFPAETWHGRTWLEQNRLYAKDEQVIDALLSCCPADYQFRYLSLPASLPPERQTVDEVGYLFFPPKYGYDIENYFKEFSHKSIKRIMREITLLEERGVTYRYNDPRDFDLLVDLNVGRFGADSYFYDERFRESFRSLMLFLKEKGWLRITTILMEGKPAAVDMGGIYRNMYTVLAGGTNGDFPGVAKLINLHHIRYACQEKLSMIDFLCGDFSWKSMFHLTPRPLYMLSSVAKVCPESLDFRSAANA